MRVLAAWLAVNGLLLAGHVVGAGTMWALGTLLLAAGPAVSNNWVAWMIVGLAGIAAAIAFLFWVVGFAHGPKKRGVRHVAGR